MGDISEMMLDGTLCECCGVYIEHGKAQGFPRRCRSCEPKKPKKATKEKSKRPHQETP